MSARAAWRLEALGFAAVFRYVGGRRDWFAVGRGMEGTRARRPSAGEVARRDAPTCQLADRLGDVRARVRSTGWDVCIVVNDSGVVLGRLGRAAWAAAGRGLRRGDHGDPDDPRPDNLLESLIEVMRAKRAKSLLITDSEGALMGLVLRRDAEPRLAARRKQGRDNRLSRGGGRSVGTRSRATRRTAGGSRDRQDHRARCATS
jgi:CBS domain-containing protein